MWVSTLLAPVALWAQDTSKARVKGIEEVVVTGQYAPGDPARAVQRVRVIDRKKIELMNAQNLKDVLTNELSVRISQDNILGSGISMNGLSGRNVKILVDGVPVIGRMDGEIDISQVNLGNIERIEMIEGPMSVTYGTDALAGTINLITRKTQSGMLEGNVTTFYESTGTYNLQGRVGYSKKKHNASLNAGRNFFDGWSMGERPSFDFSPRIADYTRYHQWKPREQYFLNLQYGYTFGNTTLNYKGDLFREKITNRGIPQQPYNEYAYDEYYHTRRTDNAVFLTSNMDGGGKVNVLASYNDYKRTKVSYYKDLVTLNERLTTGEGDQDTTRFNQFNTRGTYTGELADGVLRYEAGYDVNLQNGTGRRIKNQVQFMGDYAAYASAEYQPWQQLVIRPGLRYSHNTTYKAPLIPSLSLRYRVSDKMTVRGSYSKGFRAPDLKELYFYFYDINHNIKGNENLKAEYSDNMNASVCYATGMDKWSYKIDVSGFYNDVRDRITLVPTGNGIEYTYINIGVYKTKGLQANLEATIRNLKLAVGGMVMGLYNEVSEVETSVAKFSYTPEARANAAYTLAKWDATIALFYKYTGKMITYGYVGNVLTQGNMNAYHTADLNLSKSFLKKRFAVGVGCENIFNVTNVNSLLMPTSGAHSGGGGAVPMLNGRLLSVKLDVKLSKK